MAQFIQAFLDESVRLRQCVTELEAQLSKNSTNSSKPPSTDHPTPSRFVPPEIPPRSRRSTRSPEA